MFCPAKLKFLIIFLECSITEFEMSNGVDNLRLICWFCGWATLILFGNLTSCLNSWIESRLVLFFCLKKLGFSIIFSICCFCFGLFPTWWKLICGTFLKFSILVLLLLLTFWNGCSTWSVWYWRKSSENFFQTLGGTIHLISLKY